MNEKSFANVMNSLTWIRPKVIQGSPVCAGVCDHQGWGTEYDLARLAQTLLARLGYRPAHTVNLCFHRLARITLRPPLWCPGMYPRLCQVWRTRITKESPVSIYRCWAMTSAKCTVRHSGYRYSPGKLPRAQGNLRVMPLPELTGRAAEAVRQAAIGGFGSALGGAENIKDGVSIIEEVNLLQTSFKMDEIGLDVFDLSFISSVKVKTAFTTKSPAIADTRAGRLVIAQSLDRHRLL